MKRLFARLLFKYLLPLLLLGGLWLNWDLPQTANFDTLRQGFHLLVDMAEEVQVVDYIHNLPVAVEQLPDHLKNAVIAIEDHRFRYHPGFDPVAIAAALWDHLVEDRPLRGASTLTQQVAKNLFVNPQQTLTRKLREGLLALKLEWHYDKQQILEMYLNHAYFGRRAYGVEAAARRYFGKRAIQVNLYESALLAASLQAPGRLNLHANPQGAHSRARLVLRQMHRYGLIDQAAWEQALVTGVQPGNRRFRDIDYQYFRDWIIPRLRERLGDYRGQRLRVITTLDSELQIYGELALRERVGPGTDHPNVQGALLALSPDGAVRAMVGGTGYGLGQGRSTFNRTVQARRQLGSTFKPVVYLEALRRGYQPQDPILDAPLAGRGDWPRNHDRRYRGMVTLEQALAESLNGATVELMRQLTPTAVAELAGRLGLEVPLEPELDLALGTQEGSLLELVSAYTTVARGGTAVEPYGIIGILDSAGHVLYWRTPPAPRRVVEIPVALKLTHILAMALEEGTGRQAGFGHPAAGKTGTTQQNRDAWFVGYSAHLISGVWMGRDDQGPMTGISGGGLPALAWEHFMRNAHYGLGLPHRPLEAVRDSGGPGTAVPDS
ncbi:MAG: transglycosylase domain-containing protein [Candidatus Competibacteraceae bacterium]|nr:transglycosylase domain-containing protein [Candidatus Competibacteraceae bacterium]